MLLKDRVAIVTGGAGPNGLGFGAARMMAAEGAHIVILDLERAKPVLQYVAPSAFDRLRAPLKR